MPTERPILFSGPMVRAILDGRKTQTRRVVKPQPLVGSEGDFWWPDAPPRRRHYAGDEHLRRGLAQDLCPYGAPGDLLWVRETWARDVPGCPGGLSYRADHIDPAGDGPAHPMRWRPSIHMPRVASRITLRVEAIRVERLNDITEADARAEGIDPEVYEVPPGASFASYVAAFSTLWDAINGKRAPWASNPWVFVVSFRRLP